MSTINPLAREISAKIVYYGPGLSGKTTSLKHIYTTIRPEHRGELVSLATEGDRTIFFDFLPVRIERVRGMAVRLQLYTVPGQVFYASTRKLVLNGADGVVFVADSQRPCRDANLESIEDLKANLRDFGHSPDTFPFVLQYNKRDLPDVMPVADLARDLNPWGHPEFSSAATAGTGVLPALKEIMRRVTKALWREDRPAPSTPEIGAAAGGNGTGGLAEQLAVAAQRYAENTELAQERPPPPKRGATTATPKAATAIAAAPATAEDAQSDIATFAPPPGAARNFLMDLEADRPPSRADLNAISQRPAEDAGARGLTFRGLWDEADRPIVGAIESSIGNGSYGRAINQVASALASLLDAVQGASAASGPDVKAMLLGLDGRDYLRLCRLASMPGEAATERDALFALQLLVAARIRASAH